MKSRFEHKLDYVDHKAHAFCKNSKQELPNHPWIITSVIKHTSHFPTHSRNQEFTGSRFYGNTVMSAFAANKYLPLSYSECFLFEL